MFRVVVNVINVINVAIDCRCGRDCEQPGRNVSGR
jgi:hypothetical protein